MPDHITFECCDALRFVFVCTHRVCVCPLCALLSHLAICCCRCCRCRRHRCHCCYLPFFNKRHQKKNILHSPLFLCVLSFIFYSNQVSHLFSMLPFSFACRLPPAITFDVAVSYSAFWCISKCPQSSWFIPFVPCSRFHRSPLLVVCLYLRLYCKRRVHKAFASSYRRKIHHLFIMFSKRFGANFLTCTKYYAGAPFTYWQGERV